MVQHISDVKITVDSTSTQRLCFVCRAANHCLCSLWYSLSCEQRPKKFSSAGLLGNLSTGPLNPFVATGVHRTLERFSLALGVLYGASRSCPAPTAPAGMLRLGCTWAHCSSLLARAAKLPTHGKPSGGAKGRKGRVHPSASLGHRVEKCQGSSPKGDLRESWKGTFCKGI